MTRPAVAPTGNESAPKVPAGTPPRGAEGRARIWFAAYLGRFPEHAAVPRWELRDIACVRWRGTEDRPLRLRSDRQPRIRVEGRASSSKGRRSSHHLASHLKSFENLGLVRRDNARDVIIVTDPVGLRRLAEAWLEPFCDQYPEPVGDDS